MEFYGIVDIAYALIKSYLSNNYQRVLIKDNLLSSYTHSNWAVIKNGVPQGSILGPLLFLLCINDLPTIINNKSKPVLFADDTSIIIKKPSLFNLKKQIIKIFEQLNKWFNENLLILNFDKTYFLQFKTKNSAVYEININHNDKFINNTSSIHFLGITIDNTLSWNEHVDKLIGKLGKACYAIRISKQYVSLKTLRTIYFSYFHMLMSYGIVFWGISPSSTKVFKLQKKVRIMANTRSRDSSRDIFKELKILPFYS
jgi:hypothetical protein